jgi:transmembrane sensor
MKIDSQKDNTIQEQAGFWVFTKYSCDWTSELEKQLQDWLNQNPSHRLEYEQVLKLWQNLNQLKSISFPARQTAQQIRFKYLKRRQRTKKIKQTLVIGLFVCTSSFYVNDYLVTETYSTEIGERKMVNLADGSKITLNTNTELSVKMTDSHRLIHLKKGEMYATVAHKPNQSFDVIAGNGRIHDIGTSFNVYLKPNMTTQVTVSEGKVEIIPDKAITGTRWLDHILSRTAFWLNLNNNDKNHENIILGLGEKLAYNNQGDIDPSIKTNVANIISWKTGRVIFEMASLEDVLAQIERYHKVNFQYTNESAKQIKVTANFEIDNLIKILSTLEMALPIKINQLDDGEIIVSLKK